MGKVMQRITLTNIEDHFAVEAGRLAPAHVRRVELDALIDTGATTLALPADIVGALGARAEGTKKVKYADGRVAEVPWVTLRLEILGRPMSCDAVVQPAGTAPLIGQIPLEALDLRVDPKTCSLYVNPESPDVPLLELLAVA